MTLPPGPRSRLLPALALLRDPIGYLTRCHARHGDVFAVRIAGFGDIAYVCEPALVRRVLSADPGPARAGAARRDFLEPLVGRRSLLTTDGEDWDRQRRLVGPAFHGERIDVWSERIAALAQEEIARWPRGTPFALRPRMQALTLEVILRVVLGLDDGPRLERLRQLLPALMEAAGWLVWLPALARRAGRAKPPRHRAITPWRRFAALRAETDALLFAEIGARRAEGAGDERADILSMLLAARDEDGRPLPDRELRDQLLTLLQAGHDTTATALAWTFERLVRTPAVRQRLHDAVDSGDGAYLEAVAKETLRSRPAVFDTFRRVDEPMELAGFTVPVGWYVGVPIAALHQLPSLYPDPAAFRPERFLDGHPPPGAWVPFGGGRRHCTGSQLALLELTTVIREVMTQVTLTAADRRPDPPRLQHVTMIPRHGARVVAAAR